MLAQAHRTTVHRVRVSVRTRQALTGTGYRMLSVEWGGGGECVVSVSECRGGGGGVRGVEMKMAMGDSAPKSAESGERRAPGGM